MEKKSFWSRDLVEKLLLKYQEHENLYNVRDSNYVNRVKRSESFFQLYEALKSESSYITVDAIKSKIHVLRTQYARELREIEQSKRSGVGVEDVYQPKLWCFDQLEFLKAHCATRVSTSNIAFNDEGANSASSSSFSDETRQCGDTDSFGDDKGKQQDVKSRTSRKRKATSDKEERWQNVQSLLAKRLNERSEYEWLGQQVSFDLKNIRNEDVRNETIWKIQTILREAKLADKEANKIEMSEVRNPNAASSSKVSDNAHSRDILQQSLLGVLDDEDLS